MATYSMTVRRRLPRESYTEVDQTCVAAFCLHVGVTAAALPTVRRRVCGEACRSGRA